MTNFLFLRETWIIFSFCYFLILWIYYLYWRCFYIKCCDFFVLVLLVFYFFSLLSNWKFFRALDSGKGNILLKDNLIIQYFKKCEVISLLVKLKITDGLADTKCAEMSTLVWFHILLRLTDYKKAKIVT